MNCHFTYVEGGLVGTNIMIDLGTCAIGRLPEAGIVLAEETVSRVQAELCYYEDDVVTIENLSSTNPTTVNDQAIKGPIELSDGDRVRFGRVVLRFNQSKKA